MLCYFSVYTLQINNNNYIHNWSLIHPSVRIMTSLLTLLVCVNFIHEWRHLQFKIDSERQIFEKLVMAILFTLRVFARNLLRRSRRRNIFIFSYWCLTWGLNSGFTSNKPTHYLLNYGNINNNTYCIDFCNGTLQTTITLFKRTESSHKTDWTSLTSIACFMLPFIRQI